MAPLIPRIESAEVGSKPLAYLTRSGSDFRGDRIRCDTGSRQLFSRMLYTRLSSPHSTHPSTPFLRREPGDEANKQYSVSEVDVYLQDNSIYYIYVSQIYTSWFICSKHYTGTSQGNMLLVTQVKTGEIMLLCLFSLPYSYKLNQYFAQCCISIPACVISQQNVPKLLLSTRLGNTHILTSNFIPQKNLHVEITKLQNSMPYQISNA